MKFSCVIQAYIYKKKNMFIIKNGLNSIIFLYSGNTKFMTHVNIMTYILTLWPMEVIFKVLRNTFIFHYI